MTLIHFLHRLLGKEKPSAVVARERLQLVLAHDRSDLNPELLEQMRREILAVVQRYVEIDIDSCDVSLETEDRVTALLANLPIRRARPVPLPRSSEAGSEAETGTDADNALASEPEGATSPDAPAESPQEPNGDAETESRAEKEADVGEAV
ncbi:MAG: cell division topological specificity factor MinE [Synechococcaceae cyanobacterium]